MAAGTPSRLALKQTPLDTWSTREHLALASAVLRSGDQNWVSVSRAMRGFADAGRPSDWLSQKNCAQQYARLLELVDAPKRKRERGEPNETPGEHIVRRLRQDRTEELRRLVAEKRAAYLALKQQISQLRSGQLDSQLDDIQRQIQAEKEAAALEEERRRQRLAEREAQKVAVQQALRAQVTKAPPPKRRKLTPERRDSSLSEAGSASEPEFAEDSAASDAVAAEASGDEASREGADSRPAPSCPLLTSLLRSPSASSAGSPTLSRLLELPPAAPGYPLPRLNLFPDQAARDGEATAAEKPAAEKAESVPNSPASAVLSGDDAEERRDYRIWKKSILILWREFTAHRHASMFARPITNDQATNYREIVKHPMDLAQMKRNVEAGTVNTTLQFQRDLMLMFCNAMMFNSSDHEVHRFAREMQAECVEKIQMLLLADKQTSQRRETRESSRDDLKRKRSGDERPTPTRKRR
ncbi:bromodomain-containing protein 8-like [Pollicipes pollicipes]|uniref:bromodomain-containing protein 8-like n=1 Tax=Pollicipes pollicipes TaxID=41117 RepID=UPI001884E75B|nr:bromodomain-containing protein 8-like [Pollicipes pollicipes]